MISTETVIPMTTPDKLQTRLARHWNHKLVVRHEPPHTRIEFEAGHCVLTANGAALEVQVTADDAQTLEQLKQVIANHCQRMANWQTLDIEWPPHGAEPSPAGTAR